jgi:hypothetical protein
MDDNTAFILLIAICSTYYTIKNLIAYKRGENF